MRRTPRYRTRKPRSSRTCRRIPRRGRSARQIPRTARSPPQSTTAQNQYNDVQKNYTQADQALTTEQAQVSSHVIDPPGAASASSKKKAATFAGGAGIFFGLLVGLLGLIALTAADTAARRREDVETTTGDLQVVATIAEFPRERERAREARLAMRFLRAEEGDEPSPSDHPSRHADRATTLHAQERAEAGPGARCAGARRRCRPVAPVAPVAPPEAAPTPAPPPPPALPPAILPAHAAAGADNGQAETGPRSPGTRSPGTRRHDPRSDGALPQGPRTARPAPPHRSSSSAR